MFCDVTPDGYSFHHAALISKKRIHWDSQRNADTKQQADILISAKKEMQRGHSFHGTIRTYKLPRDTEGIATDHQVVKPSVEYCWTITLVQDERSGIHNEPIVASCHSCLESIKIVKDKFDYVVTSVVTANARKMDKMRYDLKEDDSSLVVYGCSAHLLNLLCQDITPSFVMNHVVETQRYFRDHHKPNAWLTDCPGTVKPQLPIETRWKSQLTCIDAVIKNKSSYMNIVHEHKDDMIRNLAGRFRTLGVALYKAESGSQSIADLCHMWLPLQQDRLLDPHCDVVKKRRN
ncbi:hypothetical protein LSH36_173g04010 [Paralvinella palmiformis]|uniref:DUF659 domain-containing protein n=1 Tax=Paralvinella palmiformis TaxID=53620 RepID=A0AAD9JTC9_9ANNE|nr:hypothetical protein LSH36_173g04010 [Paralvinella palmiformis]